MGRIRHLENAVQKANDVQERLKNIENLDSASVIETVVNLTNNIQMNMVQKD